MSPVRTRSPALSSPLQPVPRLAHREEVPRLRRVALQLPAELGDVGVHRPAQHRRVVPPDLLHELLAAQHRAVRLEQRPEQIELLRTEPDRRSTAPDLADRGVDLDLSEPRRRARRTGRSGPPQLGLDAGQQLEDAERLGDVVVGAEAEPADLVLLLPSRREHEHGGVVAALAHGAEDPEPVDARDHEIEDDEVETAHLERRKARRTIGRELHGVALDLEVVAEAESEIGVVLDDENRHVPSGTRTTKRAPCGSTLSTRQSPCCSVTRSRTVASPIPVPVIPSARAVSPRQNRSQTFSRSAAGTPGPSSLIVRPRNPSPLWRPTVTREPRPPYLTALSRRLRTIWRQAPGSARAVTDSGPSTRMLTAALSASGVNSATISRVSAPRSTGSGTRRSVPRSSREKWSRFSTRCSRRRASRSITVRGRLSSSSERPRSSRSVSAKSGIWASGVLSSCDAPATKSSRSRASRSRCRCCPTARTARASVSAITAARKGSRERGSPPITSAGARASARRTSTVIPPNIGPSDCAAWNRLESAAPRFANRRPERVMVAPRPSPSAAPWVSDAGSTASLSRNRPSSAPKPARGRE